MSLLDETDLPWLWVCSECGALWLAATDNDMEPGSACPDQPSAHAGACFAYELYPADMEGTLEAALSHIPPDGVFTDLFYWSVDGGWDAPLSTFPIH